MLLWKMLGRENATCRAHSYQPEPFCKFDWHQTERAFSLCLSLVLAWLLTPTGGQLESEARCHLDVSSSPTSAPGTEQVL